MSTCPSSCYIQAPFSDVFGVTRKVYNPKDKSPTQAPCRPANPDTSAKRSVRREPPHDLLTRQKNSERVLVVTRRPPTCLYLRRAECIRRHSTALKARPTTSYGRKRWHYESAIRSHCQQATRPRRKMLINSQRAASIYVAQRVTSRANMEEVFVRTTRYHLGGRASIRTNYETTNRTA